MILAGLDIATTTGCAVMENDRLLHAEAFRPKGKTDAAIFNGFRTWLRPLLVSFGVEYVGIEEPLRSDLHRKEKDGTVVPISNMKTFLRLYGLRGHAIEICHALNIDHAEFNQSSWRKSFLKNGRGDKDMAMAQCKLLRFAVPNKDAAEAVGVCWHLGGVLRAHGGALPGDLFAKTEMQGAA